MRYRYDIRPARAARVARAVQSGQGEEALAWRPGRPGRVKAIQAARATVKTRECVGPDCDNACRCGPGRRKHIPYSIVVRWIVAFIVYKP